MGTDIIHKFYARFDCSQPEPITHDSRGTLIEVGARVAYQNKDGMTLGTITRIKKNVWEPLHKGSISSWALNFQVEILNEAGFTSTIKAAANIIII